MFNEVAGAGLELLEAVDAAPAIVVDVLPVAEVAPIEPVVETAETAPKAVVEKRKVKAMKPVKDKKRGRGRPTVYGGSLATYIASVVKKHGATNARTILNANGKSNKSKELVALRNVEIVPKALNISMPTLLKLAKSKGVKLHRGRPTLKKVARKAA